MNRVPRWTLAPLVAVLVVGCGGGSATPTTRTAAPSFEYRLRLEPGMSFRQVMVNEHSSSSAMFGSAQDLQQTMTTVVSSEVVAVEPDGTASVAVIYESVRVDGTGPTGPIQYDSADPPATIPATVRAYAAMVGHRLTMTLGPHGSVRKVDGYDELRERILADLEIPDGANESMRESLDSMIDDDSLSEMFGTMTGVFPDHAVAVGESWVKSAGSAGAMPIALQATWLLESRRDGIAYLRLSGVATPEDQTTVQMGPMSMRYAVEGEQTGSVEVDEATGWTRRMQIESRFEGTMHIDMPGVGRNEVPISTHGTMTIEPFVEGS